MKTVDLHENFKSIETIHLSTANEFLDFLNLSNPRWGENVDCHWLFRGHKSSNWSLQPRAWREDGQLILKPIREKLMSYTNTVWDTLQCRPPLRDFGEERVLDCVLQTAAEYEAVRQFAILSDELGYPTTEANQLVDGFDFIQNSLGFDWPGLFYIDKVFGFAQHHGIPTRLLDWTRNSLVAAFFAAESENKNNGDDRLAVWAVNLEVLKKYHLLGQYRKIDILTCPRHEHTFLHVQDALFLWIYPADELFLKQGSWPKFEEVLEDSFKENWPHLFRKITIPVSESDKILQLLWRHRISRAHLMPTYDNITSVLQVKSKWP